MLSEEENIAIETLKEVASDDFDTLGDDISPKMAQNILNVINNQQKEIEEKNIAVNKMSKDISRQLEEIEEKATIIMAGAEKVKQLEKKIVDLETKLAIETIDNKYNQEERDEETIPRYKIREKIKELEKQNEENKIELAKGIDMLSSNIIEKAKNNIVINMSLRDILKELLEEN